jgi:hypothetical protein
VDFSAQRPTAQVGRQRHDAIDKAGARQLVDQGAETADGNAHQPDGTVAARPLRLQYVGIEALDEGLVVVIRDIGMHQQHIRRQIALAHRAHEAFTLELIGLQKSARQKDHERFRA